MPQSLAERSGRQRGKPLTGSESVGRMLALLSLIGSIGGLRRAGEEAGLSPSERNVALLAQRQARAAGRARRLSIDESLTASDPEVEHVFCTLCAWGCPRSVHAA